MTMEQFLQKALLVLSLYLIEVNGDYECVCNYNVEQSVLPKPNSNAQPLGYLYEFDCKPKANADGLDASTWLAVAFEHQLGYVHMNAQIQEQICPGSIPDYDMLTTTTTPSTTTLTTTPRPTTIKLTTQTPTTEKTTITKTTPKPSTTTGSTTTTTPTPSTTTTKTGTTLKPTTAVRTTTATPKETTTPTTPKTTTSTLSSTTLKLTTTTTTPKPTTTTITTTTMIPITTPTMTTSKPTTTTKPSTMKLTTTTIKSTTHSTTPATTVDPVIGNTDLCPVVVQQNSKRARSQLGQYNSSCYELIMTYNDTWMNAESKCVVRGGHLADITDKGKQLFLTRFLQRFSPHHAVWIGLNDRKVEGKFEWTSGASTSFFNWYKGHSNHFLSHNIEDCTVFIPYQNGSWDDLPCQIYHNKPVHYPTLCEYRHHKNGV